MSKGRQQTRTALACARAAMIAVLLVSCAESRGPDSPEVVGVQQQASALSTCVGTYVIDDGV